MHTHFEAEDHEKGVPGIRDQATWYASKRRRDTRAAVALIDDIFQDEVLDRLQDATLHQRRNRRLVVLAPAATPSESSNALAITYAQWLGEMMGWDVAENVYQRKDFSKDGSDFWPRFTHSSEFYGHIEPGRHYVLADDIFTLGGTLADLRGFVETNDATVVAMTALAHRSGKDVQISLADKTRFGLKSVYGSELDELCAKELGYGQDCLTEPEANRLLGFASIDRIRKGIDGAANG